ncbi:MAG: response regulator [Kordiimonadaceae bacterium]|jgi:two-component system, chemotaxis family, chemotaxis protein CheY|nr:response regulator [Kordiimonadaceae bacterium]MBT6036792.1 response regulator [Kordiimonadaceae bacterium]MBT6330174.1 response regulator [Kordiimonadaceae bacterium]MBT7582399.1 response regulator [Kordiimonadaceae bacterium]
MLENIKIMVIDDQATMRKIISQLLYQIGKFNIIEAANGIQALEILNSSQTQKIPDVIISDLHMDGMDGIELCNKLRLSKKPGIREIPVLMLTGESDEFILKVSKQVGAFRILSKPIGSPELKGHISAALGFEV